MILVGQFDSPYVRRVAISLHLSSIPFDRDTRSVFADADEIRTINPLGRIPALVLDDGEVLLDSAAILDHLDERLGPERALLPARSAERRAALRIIALATGTLDKAGAIVYERTLRPADKVFAAWIDRCRTQVDGGLAALQAVTGTGWYLKDRPMQPDITVACVIAYLRDRVPEAMPAGRYPALERLAGACEVLDAFVATRPAPEELMPAGL
jgi:glutathione S-transferase